MSALPADKSMAISAYYNPTGAWNPPCEGKASEISSNHAWSITLPATNVQGTLNIPLDSMTCGWIK